MDIIPANLISFKEYLFVDLGINSLFIDLLVKWQVNQPFYPETIIPFEYGVVLHIVFGSFPVRLFLYMNHNIISIGKK